MFWLKALVRLAKDQDGQDLVEYGLLAGAVAAAGYALFPDIVNAIGAAFAEWNSSVNDAWIPDPPQ